LIRGEQSAADTYAAMDAVIDKIDRQIIRYKTKRSGTTAKSKAAIETKARLLAESEAVEPSDDGQGRLVRVKRFAMKPMDVEEALEQMQLLGHDFFVFHNSETEKVSVVYKRDDGNFGLIEPDTI
jgi:putative sigma-54 modulation protein